MKKLFKKIILHFAQKYTVEYSRVRNITQQELQIMNEDGRLMEHLQSEIAKEIGLQLWKDGKISFRSRDMKHILAQELTGKIEVL